MAHTMWALSYVSPPGPLNLLIHKATKTPQAVTANSQSRPPQNDVGGFDRSLLTAFESKPKPTSSQNPEEQKPKRGEEEEEEGKHISGSDVLWAMQKAAAKKNRLSGKSKNKKKKMSGGLSSAGGHREELAGDYSNVRPLCIKSEWGTKLDELEKSLQELYDTK